MKHSKTKAFWLGELALLTLFSGFVGWATLSMGTGQARARNAARASSVSQLSMAISVLESEHYNIEEEMHKKLWGWDDKIHKVSTFKIDQQFFDTFLTEVITSLPLDPKNKEPYRLGVKYADRPAFEIAATFEPSWRHSTYETYAAGSFDENQDKSPKKLKWLVVRYGKQAPKYKTVWVSYKDYVYNGSTWELLPYVFK